VTSTLSHSILALNAVAMGDKKGYGGQKFPKLAKPAKTTKKFTRILTCTVCKKKFNTYGIRVRKFELVAV